MTRPLFRAVGTVGASYRPLEAQTVYRTLKEGDKVFLKPVTTNPYDPLACEVWAVGHHVAFLPKEVSAVIHAIIHTGEARVAKVERGVVRIDVDTVGE